VRTQLPSSDDERAMADLAEVPDWKLVWGPTAVGVNAVHALADRVSAAPGWRPWVSSEIDPQQYRRRHLAVWLRPGAQIHLYAGLPSADSATASVGFGYSVYASEAA
jgi:hypothetical protein